MPTNCPGTNGDSSAFSLGGTLRLPLPGYVKIVSRVTGVRSIPGHVVAHWKPSVSSIPITLRLGENSWIRWIGAVHQGVRLLRVQTYSARMLFSPAQAPPVDAPDSLGFSGCSSMWLARS